MSNAIYDVAIIGGGTTAALLARAGRRVVLCEQIGESLLPFSMTAFTRLKSADARIARWIFTFDS